MWHRKKRQKANWNVRNKVNIEKTKMSLHPQSHNNRSICENNYFKTIDVFNFWSDINYFYNIFIKEIYLNIFKLKCYHTKTKTM